MAFDANGDLYVGGNFTNLAGIANADYFAKYTISNNTWSAIGSGINSTVQSNRNYSQMGKYLLVAILLLQAVMPIVNVLLIGMDRHGLRLQLD